MAEDAKDFTKRLASMREEQAELSKQADAYALQVDRAKELLSVTTELSKVKDVIKALEKEIGESTDEELKLLLKREKILERQLELRAEELEHAEEFAAAAEKLNKLEKKRQALLKQSLSVVDDTVGLIKKIPIVGDFLYNALGANTLKDKLNKKLSKVLSKDTGKSMGGMFGKGMLVGTLVAIAAIGLALKEALHVDKEVTELAKQLGVSREESYKVFKNLEKAAKNSKVLGNSGTKMVEAYEALRTELGSSAMITEKMAEANVLLTQQYGLQSKEAVDFQLASEASGKSATAMAGQVISMVSAYNQITGDSISHADVMQDIAKTSKMVQSRYGGMTKELIKASIQAKKLGLTLEETANISMDFLNIEESISDEVNAQVLSGKAFNLDMARGLALQGKSAEAVAEAISQTGYSYDDFVKLGQENILAQQAIAKAAGVSVDQYLEAARIQKFNATLGKDAVKNIHELTDTQRQQLLNAGAITNDEAEQLALQQQQASAAEKFEQAMDRIKLIFSTIVAGPLGDFLNLMATLLDNVYVMYGVLGAIGTVITIQLVSGLASMGKSLVMMIPKLATILGLESGIATAKLAGAAIATLGLGTLAIGAAIVAGKALIKSSVSDATQVADGVIDPQGGLVVSGPKGSIQLDPQDSIVAGTDLGGTSAIGNNGSSVIAEKLDKLITMVSQPVVIKIGDKSIQELDTAISLRRNYTSRIGTTYGATV